jgi:hypothetical protein
MIYYVDMYNKMTYLIIYTLIAYSLCRSVLRNDDLINKIMNVMIHILWGYLWPLFAIYFFFTLFLENPQYTIY